MDASEFDAMFHDDDERTGWVIPGCAFAVLGLVAFWLLVIAAITWIF